ncbi:hypothetical protein [Absidia glauca]|uniref:Uncharacterized protein n=1 Tax=Absidia glauca TaxID=4829 RepID=A0A168NXD6_ABSGL|nr:hypothetical protein [Absidia glauca]
MTSYPTRHFSSSHEADQQASWTKGHSIEGQEALVVDSSYDLYDPITTQPADHSSTSSLSSMASLFSNTIEAETDIIEASRPQMKLKLQQRSLQRPLFENTSDWDTPSQPKVSISNPPRSFSWPESIQLVLKCLLWLSFFSWVYKVYSCIDLKQMPTERLYAVDPGAPINVWIPVSVTFVTWCSLSPIPLFPLSTGVPMDLLETRLVWKVSRINNMDHWDNDWYLLVALETAAMIFWAVPLLALKSTTQ